MRSGVRRSKTFDLATGSQHRSGVRKLFQDLGYAGDEDLLWSSGELATLLLLGAAAVTANVAQLLGEARECCVAEAPVIGEERRDVVDIDCWIGLTGQALLVRGRREGADRACPCRRPV